MPAMSFTETNWIEMFHKNNNNDDNTQTKNVSDVTVKLQQMEDADW